MLFQIFDPEGHYLGMIEATDSDSATGKAYGKHARTDLVVREIMYRTGPVIEEESVTFFNGLPVYIIGELPPLKELRKTVRNNEKELDLISQYPPTNSQYFQVGCSQCKNQH